MTIVESREMAALYEAGGVSIADLAERFNRGIGTVHRHLKMQGVEVNPPSLNVKPLARRTPHEVVERTVELYASGLTIYQVGEEMGVCASVIAKRLRDAGVRTRKFIAHENEVELVRLYLSGLTLKEAGERFGVTSDSVRLALRRRGLQPRTLREHAALRRQGMRDVKASDVPPRLSERKVSGTVPAGPLGDAAYAVAARRVRDGQEDALEAIARDAGVASRTVRAWQRRERAQVQVSKADAVLAAADLMWWEVWARPEPPHAMAGPATDVLAYIGRAMSHTEARAAFG